MAGTHYLLRHGSEIVNVRKVEVMCSVLLFIEETILMADTMVQARHRGCGQDTLPTYSNKNNTNSRR